MRKIFKTTIIKSGQRHDRKAGQNILATSPPVSRTASGKSRENSRPVKWARA
jgi:hypothetical protein